MRVVRGNLVKALCFAQLAMSCHGQVFGVFSSVVDDKICLNEPACQELFFGLAKHYPVCNGSKEVCTLFPWFYSVFLGYNCGSCRPPFEFPPESCNVGEVSSNSVTFPTQSDVCPTGEESCCGLTFEECRALVYSFQLDFQTEVIGDNNALVLEGPIIPLNVITDDGIFQGGEGSYAASSLCGTDFVVNVQQVLLNNEEILESLTDDPDIIQEDIQQISMSGQRIILFVGDVNGENFRGTAVSANGLTYLYISDAILDIEISPPTRQRRTLQATQPFYSERNRLLNVVSCSAVFDAAIATFACPNSEPVSVVPACRNSVVSLCETSVAASLQDFENAVNAARATYDAAIFALEAKHARDIAIVFVRCAATAVAVPAYLICVATGVAVVEAKRFAIKLAAETALELAIEAAIENRDVLIQGFLDTASAGVDACIECECEDTADPCCGSEDPCCGSDDPCCESDDPCCGSDDPCCQSSDPCCDSDDPCCGSGDPCCGSSNPCCTSGECENGGANGDPHIVTFDNYRYSCQGKGEFVLFQALPTGALVQSRFENQSPLVSFATGMAATGGFNSSTVQLSIPETGSADLELFVDATQTTLGSYDDEIVSVFQNGDVYTVFFKQSGLNVVVRYIRTSFRHLSVQVQVPPALRSDDIRGLLGSPDNIPLNDWMDSSGVVVPVATTGRRDQAAYDYCTTHWCTRSDTDSLFTYNPGFGFDFYNGCDDPYPGSVDVGSAPQPIQDLCGVDSACLIDGIELGEAGAQELLELESLLTQTSSSTRFRAVPSNIVVSDTVNVVLTVDLRDFDETSAIESFSVFRVDSSTLQPAENPVLTLRDNGNGVDEIAGDSIFTGVLATTSNNAGETFSFQAVPQSGGSLDFGSEFNFLRLDAVQSYSVAAGIGEEVGETSFTLNAPSIDQLQLIAQYTWPTDQRDLDTGTSFLSSTVGFACSPPSAYMEFSGDNTGSGGLEEVNIRLGAAFEDGAWTDSVPIVFNAQWFSSAGGQGPASLTIFLQQQQDGVEIQLGSAVSFPIQPGTGGGCAATVVGSANVVVGSTGEVEVGITVAAS